MDKNKYDIIRLKMERTANALRKNNMICEIAENTEEALEIVTDLLNDGDTVAVGGSQTLFEAGIIEMLRAGNYRFLDRYAPGLTREQLDDVHHSVFCADVFLTSSNAITEKGELYNVDGTGNRVAAMLYGPRSVIVITGFNKIVRDLDAAKTRVEEIAAPANCVRLHMNTPCTELGKCANCNVDGRICADTVVIGRQRVKDRIKVVLVGEELGY